jgi:regulatory protein
MTIEAADDPAFPDADPEAVARQILLRRLTDQPRSRAELAEALAKRQVPPEVATRLLDRFTEVGLIDDEAFARAWVQSRMTGRGLARRALQMELRRKGVDDELVRQVLDDVAPAEEEAAARRIVQRKLRSTAALEPQVRMRRLVGALARKGYPSGLAMRVVREELADDDA